MSFEDVAVFFEQDADFGGKEDEAGVVLSWGTIV
jgi:hypothetical protein